MSKKILIVGGVAGGASVAARARRLDEDARIIIFERGQHVSFSNCSLPFFLSRTVKKSENLVLMNPSTFKSRYNIEVRVRNEVLSIDRAAKKITVKNMDTEEIYYETYDKLVLSPGAMPVRPMSIKGVDRENVFTVRNVDDICALDNYVSQTAVKTVAVIGGGFIGIEVAENLKKAGKDVFIVEALAQVLTPFDQDMVQIIHKELHDNGVQLYLGDGVSSIEENGIILGTGLFIESQAVVLAIGVRPEISLARDAGLEIGETGSIKVDSKFRTNDSDIYAVGDAIEVENRLLGSKSRLTLAGPAQLEARIAANNMFGINETGEGFIGSSVLRIFNLNAASTGLNEKAAGNAGLKYGFSYVIPNDKVGLMPESHVMHFKLLYEIPGGKILGAQAIGKGAVDKRIDVIAAMISMGGTVDNLKKLELCYSPLFGTARDVVNQAAFVASNLLSGKFRQVPVSKVRELVESGAYIIDVREKNEYARGHIINSVNIPLSEFRERLSEIPKDRPVYLHCRSAQRSYNAVMILENRGYKNVYNISGSFLGICLYEYFHDLSSGRSKIVTEYNFN
ncbi:MAG: FAD-dependent oxidoreductase [Sphaerochaeta sp.]